MLRRVALAVDHGQLEPLMDVYYPSNTTPRALPAVAQRPPEAGMRPAEMLGLGR